MNLNHRYDRSRGCPGPVPPNLAAGNCARPPPLKPPAGEPRHSPPLPDAGIPVPTRDCHNLSYRRPYLPAVAGPRPTSKRARPNRNSGLPDSPRSGTIGPLRYQAERRTTTSIKPLAADDARKIRQDDNMLTGDDSPPRFAAPCGAFSAANGNYEVYFD